MFLCVLASRPRQQVKDLFNENFRNLSDTKILITTGWHVTTHYKVFKICQS